MGILFFTDLHYGRDLPSRGLWDVNVYGQEWAWPALDCLIDHARKEEHVLISGGDNTTFNKPSSNISARGKHKGTKYKAGEPF